MVTATRTTITSPATLNQQTLGDAIKSVLSTAGLTTVYDDTVTSTNRNIVYQIVVDSTKTYGTWYYRIRIDSTLNIITSAGTAWNKTTAVMTNGTSETGWGIPNGAYPTSIVAVNCGTDGSLAFLLNNNTVWTLGVFFPATRPSWWDMNFWTWGFHFSHGAHATCKSTTVNPYGNENYNTLWARSDMAYPNNQFKFIDILRGNILFSQSNQGIAGRVGDDWGIGCFYGISPFQTDNLPSTGELFFIPTGGSGGLCIKIAS